MLFYSYSSSDDVNVCYTYCDGSEDRLTDCYLVIDSYCYCDEGVVGITCSKYLTYWLSCYKWSCDLTVSDLSAGEIVAIVMGVLLFFGLIATCVIFLICCLSPICPCYYQKYHTTRTVVVAQQTPRVVTATTANTMAVNYQPLPPAPPAYNPATDYKPYPAAPPPATSVNY